MKNWKKFPRVFFLLAMLTLLAGTSAPAVGIESVSAAPMRAVLPGDVVISEFRTRGTGGAGDEFVEIYNPKNFQVDVSGLLIRTASSTGGPGATRYTFPTGVILQAGQHYIVTASMYSGTVTETPPAVLSAAGIADNGGIAITLPDGTTIIDAVGMSAGTIYKESTFLTPFVTDTDQSYERRLGGLSGSCIDSSNNISDFAPKTPSDPQNLSSAPIVCILVTNVSSTNGTYAVPAVIPINVTFNGPVTVDTTVGTPSLLLETGTIDGSATYVSGSGSNTLTFNYTIAPGDISSDLDYVATSSLSLNGGTITGVTGNAALTLPSPGTAGSLGANNAIVIDNLLPPSVTINQTGGQPDPANSLPVNFTVMFSEPINVGTFTVADITQSGTATGIVWNIVDSGNHMNFTLSAITATGNGTIIPSILANQVTDVLGNNNLASTSTDNTVAYNDNIAPSLTLTQASGQVDPATTLPVNFTVVFSEPINVGTFTVADITQSGTATGITWNIVDSGNHMTFTLAATAVTGVGTLVPSIAAGLVTDLAGNNNTASILMDNSVTYSPAPTPTATATLAAAPLSVLINEVAWSGTPTTISSLRSGDEWIELYNTNTYSINLNGWKMTIENTTAETDLVVFTASDVIPAGGYFILARSFSGTCNGSSGDIDIFNDIVEDGCFITQLTDNPGQILRLKDGLVDIDVANSDGLTWPAGSLSSRSSMERRGKILDSTSAWATFNGTTFFAHNRDNIAIRGTPKRANWITTITPTPTRTPVKNPTATPRPHTTYIPPVGRPIINEFLPRPGFDWNQDGKVDVFDEFIEIKNIGNASINLSGWKLDDEVSQGSNPFTLPSVTLNVGERMVFYGSQTNILLGDGGDTVRLIHPNGKIYDAYTYKIAKVEDRSVCRLMDGNGSWYEDCIPTPNLTNSRQGTVPSMPGSGTFESPVCNLPDTLPADFLFAECRGYGADIWHSFYWDKVGWQGDQFIPENTSKWESFVE